MSVGSTAKKSLSPDLVFGLVLNLTKRLSVSRDRHDRGLTLIEGLVAIIVIAITIVSIAPPIFWATGTRVKNRKTEQAIQLAQGEIDRVRTLIERDEARVAQLPPTAGSEDQVRNGDQTVKAPARPKPGGNMISSISACNTYNGTPPTDSAEYVVVDTDPQPSGCKAEFLVQTFRSNGIDASGNPITSTTTDPAGFVMGVRVYSIVAESFLPNLKAKQASLRGSSGLGQQRLYPLAVQYSTIVKSSASQNLSVYRALCPTTDKGQC